VSARSGENLEKGNIQRRFEKRDGDFSRACLISSTLVADVAMLDLAMP